VANTLAYFGKEIVTAVKSFMVNVPGGKEKPTFQKIEKHKKNEYIFFCFKHRHLIQLDTYPHIGSMMELFSIELKMDTLKLTGLNLGRIFNFRRGLVCICHAITLITKTA
jgi:hypothetical protein